MANRHYHFKFNVEKDATYIKRLDAQPNMQNYIRRLILSDIAADELRDSIQLYVDTDIAATKEAAKEFQRRADLMARYCHGAVQDNDPDYCYSCIWSYHPDNNSDAIRCKFDGLTADEMEKLIKDRLNSIYGRMLKDPFKEDVIESMIDRVDSDGSEQV